MIRLAVPAMLVGGWPGRNALRGFGVWEEDLAIRREFPIHEQVELQFRAELFNIFNHPNIGSPADQNSSPVRQLPACRRQDGHPLPPKGGEGWGEGKGSRRVAGFPTKTFGTSSTPPFQSP